MSSALSILVLFISLLQLINGAQFLNIRFLLLSSTCLAATSFLVPVIVIYSVTNIYASPQSHKLDFSIVVLSHNWNYKLLLIDHFFQFNFLF